MTLTLGCIADDLSGATDLANTLSRGGMRTVVHVGIPGRDESIPSTEAVVIALKSRNLPAAEAVSQSVQALGWLRRERTRRFFFKYCSTFDSTKAGNIGPVADALLDSLDERFTIACPAFPDNGRTVYQGHLFVHGTPLAESPMRHHPLTPMTDSNLVRVLGRQTPHLVGLASYDVIRLGVNRIRARFAELAGAGIRHAVCDALRDEHLLHLARASADLKLITGGSGLAIGLPEALDRHQGSAGSPPPARPAPGREVVLAGSCSAATLAQVEDFKRKHPAYHLHPGTLDGADAIDTVCAWAEDQADGPILVYTSAPPEDVTRLQEALGREETAASIERAFARIAANLERQGFTRFVVAGGETCGAVVTALGVRTLDVGPQIDPGVPWTVSRGDVPLGLALKSGNFGTTDFFTKAFGVLEWTKTANET